MNDHEDVHYKAISISWILNIENKNEMNSFYFTGYYKKRQSVITIYDSSGYYILRQLIITIYDAYVIAIHDTFYYISRQVLQFTTEQRMENYFCRNSDALKMEKYTVTGLVRVIASG